MVPLFPIAYVLVTMTHPPSVSSFLPTMFMNLKVCHVAMESVTTSPIVDTLVNVQQVSIKYYLHRIINDPNCIKL